jgi:hypothetical protein
VLSYGMRYKTVVSRHRLILVAFAILLSLVLSACGRAETDASASASNASNSTGSLQTQTSEGGEVTVKVTWQGLSAGPMFTVVMDTHAVDLDVYDLRELAVLRTDRGREVQPAGWDAPKGGHHREGTLTFPTTGPDGNQWMTSSTRNLELVIRNVAGVPERVFRWTVVAN